MTYKVEKLDHYGRGISHTSDNKIIFINNALPMEEVDVEVTKETSKYLEGNVTKYKTISPKRVKSKCPYYEECGGCQIRHMSYDDTLDFKKEKLKNIFNKFANMDIDPVIIKNKNKDFYRNKLDLKVVNGEYGLYKKGSHTIVPIDRCMNVEEAINTVLLSTNILHIKNGSVLIKTNYNKEIILNITSSDQPNIEIEKLREKCKLVGIIYNEKLIFGADHFIEIIDNKFFKESYNSFFQINRYMNQKLFELIDAHLDSNGVVVDMCSGVGTLGIMASYKSKKVYSLEIVENSIRDGLLNAKMNKRDNIEFMLGDAFSNVDKIQDNIDTFIIDPPRSGLNEQALSTILRKEPSKVIYISCDPMTLCRDLNTLKDKYSVEKVYLLDMFSYTFHVESMSLLSLKENHRTQ